jgi:phosphoserine phosphatase
MNIGIAILDMDGTLLSRRSIDVLCEELGFMERLARVNDMSRSLPAYRISEIIATFFQGLTTDRLQRLFDSIPLNNGVNEFIDFLKSNQFYVAIATDSYQFLAEKLGEKIGADMAYGNIVETRDGFLTGKLLTDHRCLKIEGCKEFSTCKLWFMRRLKNLIGGFTVAIGDGDSDLCMIKEADIGIAYRPKSQVLAKTARIVVSDFAEITPILEERIVNLRR